MSKECSLRYCDCYNKKSAACWHCRHAVNPEEGELSDEYTSIKDRVTVLYDYLAEGRLPDGVKCFQPKMSRKHAFSVIWFLQEIIHCLPDHIEQCDGCSDLFDTDSEGYCLDDQYELAGKTLPKKYWGHWCNSCVPNVEFALA